ncbi:MAG: hypothetical protein JNK23_07970 [Opitutaceae bacterium]|nr:hypothetical protein [Opitutaceae bacterium]
MPTAKPSSRQPLSAQRRRVVRKIATIREEVEDLLDSVQLLEARAKDIGVRHSTNDVRAKLGLAPLRR